MSTIQPTWVLSIQQALLERDRREKQHDNMVQAYHALAKQTLRLQERNTALLAAANSKSVGAGGGGGEYVPSLPVEAAPVHESADRFLVLACSLALVVTGSNPVRAAFLASVEAQLAETKHELSEQYKIQSSNAQRLLALTDTLREAEDRSRDEKDELRRLRTEVDGLKAQAKFHKEVVAEKEKQLVIIQDDHASLELELNQLTIQNENYKTDNASLLARWIAAKNEEATRMNEANVWIQEAKQQAEVLKSPQSPSTPTQPETSK